MSSLRTMLPLRHLRSAPLCVYTPTFAHLSADSEFACRWMAPVLRKDLPLFYAMVIRWSSVWSLSRKNSIVVSYIYINVATTLLNARFVGFVWLQCTAKGWLPLAYQSVTLDSVFPAWRNDLTEADLKEDERDYLPTPIDEDYTDSNVSSQYHYVWNED